MAADYPLRVCIVTRVVNAHAIGGMQQHTDDLARALVAAGHEVTILTSRIPALGPDGHPPDLLGGVRWVVADVDMPSLPYTRAWGRASARAFERLTAEHAIDIVHSESAGALGLKRAGLLRLRPWVVNFHGNAIGYMRAQFLAGWAQPQRATGMARALKRVGQMAFLHYGGHMWAYRDAEAIVVSPEQVDDTVRSHLLRRERTHVVPNGVDVAEFRPGRADAMRKRWGITPEATVILTLGRLAMDKGNDIALRALPSLPEATLVIAGSGGEEGNLRALARAEGVADRVRFPGVLAQVSVPEAMRAADIYWFPTVRDEAAPLVMLQAMASGLPVVASDIGGIPGTVARRGEEAILVPPRDVPALVEATKPLLASPDRRRRMGAAARARAESEYSIETMGARTVAVYRTALGRARQTRGRAR